VTVSAEHRALRGHVAAVIALAPVRRHGNVG